jgi:oligoendopeptidase F
MLERKSRLMMIRSQLVLPLIAVGALTITLVAHERDRSKIPDKYKWNLQDIYASDAAWRTAKDKLSDEYPQIAQYKGRLTSSASALADGLEKQSSLSKELMRLYVYAGLLADQDTRDSDHQGMRQQMADQLQRQV